MHIRQIKIGDYRAAYRLIRQSFAQSQVSDGHEQDWVIAQRSTTSYVPALELVAEQAGGLVGHVMLTERTVQTEEGECTALYLAPLCVRPDQRGQGIGGALLAEAFTRAAQMGYRAAFLVGDPAYYSRFGFRPVTDFGIENGSPVPDRYVQAVELHPGALQAIHGTLHLSA